MKCPPKPFEECPEPLNSDHEEENTGKPKKIKRGEIPHVTIEKLGKDKEKKLQNFTHLCFAGVGYRLSEDVHYFRYLVRNHVTEKQATRYLQYCFNSFPFMSCLEEKTPQEILKEGATVNLKVHSAMKIMCAWTAVRYIEEYPEVLEWWDQALEMGIAPDMAFIMAHAYTKITIYDNLGGHGLMDGHGFTEDDFHKFDPKTNEKFVEYLDSWKKPYCENPDWFGIDDMFSKCFKFKKEKW